MNGKKRCKILKEIRQKIAEANDIEFITSECQHKGDCLGTCPKCEAELRYLERELEKRQSLGKTVIVAGLSAVIATSAIGCDDWVVTETGGDPLPDPNHQEVVLDGDIATPPEDELMGEPMWPDESPEIQVEGEIEMGGDPLPDWSFLPEDIDPDLTPDSLTSILLSNVTRDGLYNSLGWAERHLRGDETSDTYRCPISTFDILTVVYDEQGYIIDVVYADEQASDAVVLPEDDLP